MSDYISRQAAEEALASWNISFIVLNPVPSANVRENVRGEWIYTPIENGMVVAMCPICKKCSAITQSVKKWYRFCPNCGADMRGEANV